jgi:hypothetical protein
MNSQAIEIPTLEEDDHVSLAVPFLLVQLIKTSKPGMLACKRAQGYFYKSILPKNRYI